MEKTMIDIRGVRIGEGIPKICVPLTDMTGDSLIKSASHIRKMASEVDLKYAKEDSSGGRLVDLVEWRLDWFTDIQENAKVLKATKELRSVLGDLPLLTTIRTSGEGGNLTISPERYHELNLLLAETGLVDLMDVEVFFQEDQTRDWIQTLQEKGVRVIGSWHCFDKTPEQSEMERRLCRIQELGADICKLAVMPKGIGDVVRLLRATRNVSERYADRPLITMSMSGLGAASRVTGEYCGSAVTFGTIGRASAPGQIPVRELRQILVALHKQKKLVLTGFMGSGKSTQGITLAEGLGCSLYDTDQMIEAQEGMSIRELFARKGESYFRQQETAILRKLKEQDGLAVISTGGGMPMNEANHQPMQELGLVIFLEVLQEEVAKRLKGDTTRPLLAGSNPKEKIGELLKIRTPLYEKAADIKLFL